MTTPEQFINELEAMELNDENLIRVKKAADSYCGNYWLQYGFKRALIMEIDDQHNNHPEDQKENDMDKLSDIINGAI